MKYIENNKSNACSRDIIDTCSNDKIGIINYDIIDVCQEVASECGVECQIMTANALTTYKGGGSACVFTPKSEEEFVKIYSAFIRRGIKAFILGGGSNVILADGLCKVPILCTKQLNGIRVCDDGVYAECGARICDVTAALKECGMGGFEFLSGVPATVGGAVRMNAGAFNAQTADYIKQVRVLSHKCDDNGIWTDFAVETVSRDKLDFGYRQGVNAIILGATIMGREMEYDKSVELSKRYLAIRAAKQPKYPSCGSVFANGELPSGKLIEECGLKGVRVGGAMISEMHGNFIVNAGGGTANDFMSLVKLCEKEVYAKFGIMLRREFVYLK
ncbi:MAG: UDP-N-acetylmuramate dehydrogenase [Clostridia bacterium]|nr:UDP-N-acetylmuramate dehydrogenase [Clostridia bacterium]